MYIYICSLYGNLCRIILQFIRRVDGEVFFNEAIML